MSSSNTSSIASYSTVNMIGQGARVGLSFIATLVASKYLGAEGYGEVNLILGYTAYLGYLLTAGFDQSLPFFKENSSFQAQFYSYVKVGVLQSFLLGLFITTLVAIFFGMSQYGQALSVSSLWACSLLLFQTIIIAIGSVLCGFFRAEKKFLPVILREQFTFGIIHFGGVILFVRALQLGSLGFAISYALASVAGLILLLFFLYFDRSRFEKVRLSPLLSFDAWKSSFLYSLPLGLMNTLEPLLSGAAIIIMGYYLDNAEVGKYSIALRLSFFVQFMFVALQPIIGPFLASLLQAEKKAEAAELIQTICYWSSKWALLFSFFLIVSSAYLLTFFGDSYIGTEIVILLLIPGFIFEGFWGALKQSLIMGGFGKINLYNISVAIVLNVILGLLLVPKYGVLGGAISLSSAYISVNLLRIYQIKAYMDILPLNFRQVRNLLILLVMLIVCYLVLIRLNDVVWQFVGATLIFLTGLSVVFWKDRSLFIKIRRR